MRIGIDLGGTKIEGIVLDDAGKERARVRVATPQGSYQATVEAVAAVVRELEATAGGRCRIGVGHPGAISPATGLIKNANSTQLNGQPLDRDLKRILGRDEVRLSNDANCFAVSEAADGAGRGSAIVFGVILGTGVGGGIVAWGTPVTGANAIGGEWGHNPLPWPDDDERPGSDCYCGRRGCIETFLSGPALAAAYTARTGRAVRSEELVPLAAGGDVSARLVLDRWTHQLARACATVINLVDPNVIVLGGGLSRMSHIYTAVPRLWSTWIFSDRVTTRLVPAQYGDASGVRGAAWLWPL
jgi:fructokinase